MALARVTTWVAGQILTAAALNAEYDNVVNNPISLISPTTGAINFNLSAHTNLIITALSATSGSTGQTLTVSTAGTPIWTTTGVFSNFTTFTSGQIPVGTTSGALAPIAIGTTGQVLAVTSSNSTPAWQVIPISGGLTTGSGSTGALFYVSSSGVLTPLAIGTSGQTLQVSTGLTPTWVSVSTAAAAGGGGLSTSTVTYLERWTHIVPTSFGSRSADFGYYANDAAGTIGISQSTYTPAGGSFPNSGSTGSMVLWNGSTAAATFNALFLTSLAPDMTIMVGCQNIAGVRRIGLTAGDMTADPTNGIYFRATGAASTWVAVSRNAGTSFIIATTAVNSTGVRTLRIQVTSSGTGANVYVDNVLQGTAFTSSQLPVVGTALTFGFGFDALASSGMTIQGWQVIQNRPLTI